MKQITPFYVFVRSLVGKTSGISQLSAIVFGVLVGLTGAILYSHKMTFFELIKQTGEHSPVAPMIVEAQPVCQEGKETFTYTGSIQNFVVPEHCNRVRARVWGGGGGSPTGARRGMMGGGAAYVTADFDISPGAELSLYIAEGGHAKVDASRNRSNNEALSYVAGGGGGSSAIIYQERITMLVAGGGGGASRFSSGGAAGALSGSDAGLGDVHGTGAKIDQEGKGGHGTIWVGEDKEEQAQPIIASKDKPEQDNPDEAEQTIAPDQELEDLKPPHYLVYGESGQNHQGGDGALTQRTGYKQKNGAEYVSARWVFAPGGWGWASGGRGGSCYVLGLKDGGGGGGGGYRGGGGGGCDTAKSGGGGGGGSSYVNEVRALDFTKIGGSKHLTGGAYDPERAGSGTGGAPGKKGGNGLIILQWWSEQEPEIEKVPQ